MVLFSARTSLNKVRQAPKKFALRLLARSPRSSLKFAAKEAFLLRWDNCKSDEVPDISRVKSKGKDMRFTVSSKDAKDLELEGKSLMHKCCLTDEKKLASTSALVSPVTLVSNPVCTDNEKKMTSLLPDERCCRLSTFPRFERGMVINDLKHDKGPSCTALFGCDLILARATSSCTSSGYTETSDEIGNVQSHDAEDDWEAVAGAFYMQGATNKVTNSHAMICSEKYNSAEKQKIAGVQNGPLKPDYKYKGGIPGGRMTGMGGRVWRADDAARPPTLPRLSKQHCFLHSTAPTWTGIHSSNFWSPPPPLYCPICTEELDMTDSSFVPCSCGFRLCLFCHHRIAAEDGRCPGCRKTYNADLAMKLSRSSSVWLRV